MTTPAMSVIINSTGNVNRKYDIDIFKLDFLKIIVARIIVISKTVSKFNRVNHTIQDQ